jgi:hypothetical protein
MRRLGINSQPLFVRAWSPFGADPLMDESFLSRTVEAKEEGA